MVMVGDFNQLLDTDLTQRTGLTQVQHTGSDFWIKPYVHGRQSCNVYSKKWSSGYYSLYRKSAERHQSEANCSTISPAHSWPTCCLFGIPWYLSDINWDNVTNVTDTQTAFDIFNVTVLSLLDTFYPLRTVTVTNRDPYFITPKIKSLLRKRNRLMRRERIEKAESNTKKISQCIVDHAKVIFSPSRRGARSSGRRLDKLPTKLSQTAA